jgi:hypothetical protein
LYCYKFWNQQDDENEQNQTLARQHRQSFWRKKKEKETAISLTECFNRDDSLRIVWIQWCWHKPDSSCGAERKTKFKKLARKSRHALWNVSLYQSTIWQMTDEEIRLTHSLCVAQ